jgi:7,8-dihydropterin-6-yl-methyl-4-(beta-D-ribofuranosyl)aminobenzene 5'-phosphate synthase
MIQLSIVCENTAGGMFGILGEHGLSVLIERESGAALFDTGQGHTLAHNAASLNKDLSRVGRVLLSHGHYDHTGGLAQALKLTGPVDVCGHPALFTERFACIKKDDTDTYRSAGIPFSRAELETLGARFVFNTGFTEIEKGLYLTGEVPRTTSFEKDDQRLVIRKDGQYMHDTIPDDQSLVLETAQGLAVILGCAHAGIINTLNHISVQLPGKAIHTVIGGTHIGFLSQEQLETTIEHLKNFSLEKIGVSHCTGLAPAMRLRQAFGDAFFFATVGTGIEIQ